ncbi:histidine kinase [Nocardia sp. CDC153]|uniref:sensor histidine kinase n=1 Tax=Nocardia sp. CDC153 TaxID=3112167 RepID=UPI002DC04942|nr:histidine kinase [Nocardia sp. CDC153]MEC3956305.1 histidine kinase [Nocardia sp. CDC153]
MIDLGGRGLRWRAVRWLPLALTPVVLAASTFPGRYHVPLVYWLLAVAACVVFALGGRWPTAVSLTVSALALPMFAIPAWGPSELVPYLGAVALMEAVMRGGRAATLWASVVWAAAWVGGHWGGHAPMFWRGATFVEAAANVGLPLLAGLYVRGQRELAASLRARAVEARSLARAEERTALARELHDIVAHHMASIVLRVKVARRVLGGLDPRVGEVFDDVGETAAGALADIRRLLAALRDPELSAVPLLDAHAVTAEIEAAVERVRAAGFVVEADIDAGVAGVDAITRLTLLRLVQESSTNAMKHADPTEPVRITLSHTDSGLVWQMVNTIAERDSATGTAGGHGLIGMGERAALVDGVIEAGARGRQWLVQAELPAGAQTVEVVR